MCTAVRSDQDLARRTLLLKMAPGMEEVHMAADGEGWHLAPGEHQVGPILPVPYRRPRHLGASPCDWNLRTVPRERSFSTSSWHTQLRLKEADVDESAEAVEWIHREIYKYITGTDSLPKIEKRRLAPIRRLAGLKLTRRRLRLQVWLAGLKLTRRSASAERS